MILLYKAAKQSVLVCGWVCEACDRRVVCGSEWVCTNTLQCALVLAMSSGKPYGCARKKKS